MTFFSFLELLAGIFLVGVALHDIFQGVVVPRWSGRMLRVAPVLLSRLWPVWKRIAWRKRDGEAREDWLGTFAPFSLMLLLILWVTLLILGFGLCFWALRAQLEPRPASFGEAIYAAGTTLLTIGYGDFHTIGGVARVFAMAAGAAGLSVFALVISLLFTLYTSFERREVLVLTLDARAGSPPSGVSLLENYAEFDLLETLPEFFDKWEEWSAQVLQSHIAYPILPFFRSGHDGESWIAALGAVLDAATLLTSSVDPDSACGGRPIGAAHLMFRMGTHTIVDLSHWFGIRFDEDPNPSPGVERIEFDMAMERLRRAGFCLKSNDVAWQLFRVKRAMYATGLNELAKHFASPPAQWIGDRSTLRPIHRVPQTRIAPSQTSASDSGV